MQSSIETVLDRVKAVLLALEKENIVAKVTFDEDAKIIKIYGEGSDYVSRASSGLADVQELAYTTAEHHPFWAILYHSNDISKTVLEQWDSKFTNDQIGEMAWRCDEIKMALDRIAEK